LLRLDADCGRADVAFVARQLGHANPAITLRVYAHLFDSEAQGTRMRDALEARFGGVCTLRLRRTANPCEQSLAEHDVVREPPQV
jgi:hypothetical protein